MGGELGTCLVVAQAGAVKGSGGGVQLAMRDYTRTLECVGFKVCTLTYESNRAIVARVRTRLRGSLVQQEAPPTLLSRILQEAARLNPALICFAFNVFPKISGEITKRIPTVPQLMLSQGVESLDYFLSLRLGFRGCPIRSSARRLGAGFLDEAAQRCAVDGVLTLSPLEVEVERWLGARRALWLPRTIPESPLNFKPVDGRVGCVSTLDHPPNHDGLNRLFGELAKMFSGDFRFRLVGHPRHMGVALAEKFSFVDYLGGLDDEGLRREAATWCCFVHPLWVYAKGCSTKLAIGLGWGLPVATTVCGARGYRWDEKVIRLAETPKELAIEVLAKCSIDRYSQHQEQAKKIVQLAPTIGEIGDSVRHWLSRWSPEVANRAAI